MEDHVFEKLAYDKNGNNLCEPLENVPKKYFVAKVAEGETYRAYSRKNYHTPDNNPTLWYSKIMFESDDYKECQQKAKELNKEGKLWK
jgi:hypothetical protein